MHSINNGKMDQFDQPGNLGAYGRVTESEIPGYWSYARRYVLADHFFASVHGPSFPNHLFTVAPQSGGAMDNAGRARRIGHELRWHSQRHRRYPERERKYYLAVAMLRLSNLA